jgi:hypothetical protein
VTRPSAPPNPRASPGHSPAIAARNAAAARATAQPPVAPGVPSCISGFDKMSFEQRRLAQDQAARRGS